MKCKANSEIDWNAFQFFQCDYQALQAKSLGKPNCLHCNKEPVEVWISDEVCDKHQLHIHFVICNHKIGLKH